MKEIVQQDHIIGGAFVNCVQTSKTHKFKVYAIHCSALYGAMTASEYDSSLFNLTEHKWSIYLWLNWKRKVNLKSTDKGESVHKSVALVVGGDLVALVVAADNGFHWLPFR